MSDIHPDNFGADRLRVHEELQEFLDIVADFPDEYGAMMRDLPGWQRRQVEDLFRDYPAPFARTKGLQMRMLRIVHAAYKADLADGFPGSARSRMTAFSMTTQLRILPWRRGR